MNYLANCLSNQKFEYKYMNGLLHSQISIIRPTVSVLIIYDSITSSIINFFNNIFVYIIYCSNFELVQFLSYETFR